MVKYGAMLLALLYALEVFGLNSPYLESLGISGNRSSYTVPAKQVDYANIAAGNAILTVTDVASLGFWHLDTTKGDGFIYPATGENTLFYGSMALGNSASYLVDDWFISGVQDEDWVTTTSPNGRLVWVSPPSHGDTMLLGYYDDSGHPSPQNVVCKQEAWGFVNYPNYDDCVILKFSFTNNGGSPITGLYAAIFCDFDIPNAMHNYADTSAGKYLAYVYRGTIYTGITLLDPLGIFAFASSIRNDSFIYPDTGMTDENQWKFMTGELNYGNQTDSDYSAMVSAGPFDLAPGDTQVVAFALVGGTSDSEIAYHADSARAAYAFGVEERIPGASPNVTLNVIPNPILNAATVTFSLPTPSKVQIAIYDMTGRLVQNLKQGDFKAGVHQLKWNTPSISAGVFFVKLKTPKTTLVKKVLVF